MAYEDPVEAGYKGIRAALLANSSLVTALGGSAVYAEAAPGGTATKPPYVIMQHMAGGSDNRFKQDAAELVYQVVVIAGDGVKAGTIGGLIRDTLHEQTVALNVGTAWKPYRCQHRTSISMTEYIDRQLFARRGGTFVVKITRQP